MYIYTRGKKAEIRVHLAAFLRDAGEVCRPRLNPPRSLLILAVKLVETELVYACRVRKMRFSAELVFVDF